MSCHKRDQPIKESALLKANLVGVVFYILMNTTDYLKVVEPCMK